MNPYVIERVRNLPGDLVSHIDQMSERRPMHDLKKYRDKDPAEFEHKLEIMQRDCKLADVDKSEVPRLLRQEYHWENFIQAAKHASTTMAAVFLATVATVKLGAYLETKTNITGPFIDSILAIPAASAIGLWTIKKLYNGTKWIRVKEYADEYRAGRNPNTEDVDPGLVRWLFHRK